jgi:hypothetical protein
MCVAQNIIAPEFNGKPTAMYSARTRNLLAAATLACGLLAGISVDRSVVTMPAWSQVGALSWAAFSRHADLGNGRLLYPTEAILAALLTCGSAVSWALERNGRDPVAIQLYGAAALTLGALLITLKAAPIMLGLQHMNDPVSLQRAFIGFYFWGNLRAACHVLAFGVELWVLSRLSDQALFRFTSVSNGRETF